MAKFAIECPVCGSYAEGKTGFFQKKKINCSCGNVINVKTNKLASIKCRHCHNDVVYDQTKVDEATCPVCHEKLIGELDKSKVAKIHCGQCSIELAVNKDGISTVCPVCDHHINIQKEIAREKISNDGIASVIKYEGGNDTLVWKHPIEDFNYGSQLIVHESQEALFFRDGQALDLFPSGRYTLETQNLPFIEKIYELPLGGENPFHSEVYFINQTTIMGIKWGTDTKVRLFDPNSGMYIEIGASGEFNLRVSNSKKLVLKLVGTTSGLDKSQLLSTGGANGSTAISGYFKAMIMTQVKSYLAQTIKNMNINILEIDSHLTLLSTELKKLINEYLDEYGLIMPEFFVVRVVTPDDDINFKRMKQQYADRYLNIRQEEILKETAIASAERKTVEAETAAKLQIIGAQAESDKIRLKGFAEADIYRMQAQAEAQEMQMKGYTYAQETSRQIGLEAMQNGLTGGSSTSGGGSSMIGDIASLGITLGAVGGVMGMTKDVMTPVMDSISGTMSGAKEQTLSQTWDCTCGQAGITSNFCPSCGSKKIEPAKGWNCSCGQSDIASNFCPNCGLKKPEPPKSWNCKCGTNDILSNFCPNCGLKKPMSWTCKCGKTEIETPFCPSCGAKENDHE
ncbi:MAG: SPFH domain-containing protein [Clostridia bacterium]